MALSLFRAKLWTTVSCYLHGICRSLSWTLASNFTSASLLFSIFKHWCLLLHQLPLPNKISYFSSSFFLPSPPQGSTSSAFLTTYKFSSWPHLTAQDFYLLALKRSAPHCLLPITLSLNPQPLLILFLPQGMLAILSHGCLRQGVGWGWIKRWGKTIIY